MCNLEIYKQLFHKSNTPFDIQIWKKQWNHNHWMIKKNPKNSLNLWHLDFELCIFKLMSFSLQNNLTPVSFIYHRRHYFQFVNNCMMKFFKFFAELIRWDYGVPCWVSLYCCHCSFGGVGLMKRVATSKSHVSIVLDAKNIQKTSRMRIQSKFEKFIRAI